MQGISCHCSKGGVKRPVPFDFFWDLAVSFESGPQHLYSQICFPGLEAFSTCNIKLIAFQ